MLSLDGCPCELEGLSSKAPRTVGRSREIGRLVGDSIDLDRFRDPLERLEGIGSPVATLRLVLLNVRHTDGRSESVLLFCRSRVSANLRRKEDVFDVKDADAEWLDRLPETEPYAELLLPKPVIAPGPISSKSRSES